MTAAVAAIMACCLAFGMALTSVSNYNFSKLVKDEMIPGYAKFKGISVDELVASITNGLKQDPLKPGSFAVFLAPYIVIKGMIAWWRTQHTELETPDTEATIVSKNVVKLDSGDTVPVLKVSAITGWISKSQVADYPFTILSYDQEYNIPDTTFRFKVSVSNNKWVGYAGFGTTPKTFSVSIPSSGVDASRLLIAFGKNYRKDHVDNFQLLAPTTDVASSFAYWGGYTPTSASGAVPAPSFIQLLQKMAIDAKYPDVADDQEISITVGGTATAWDQLVDTIDAAVAAEGYTYVPAYEIGAIVKPAPVPVAEAAPAVDVAPVLPSPAIPIPALPAIDSVGGGAVLMYNPSGATVRSLYDYALSTDFFQSIVKLFADPAEYILDLSVSPVLPSVTENNYQIYLGNVHIPGISAKLVNSQYVTLDCGQLQIQEVYQNFLDYSPHTSCSIYLPYIGNRTIPIDDIMGATIHLKYNIDILTGSCVASLNVNKTIDGNTLDSVLYQWEGNVLTHIPIRTLGVSQGAPSEMAGVLSALAAGVTTGGALPLAVAAGSAVKSFVQREPGGASSMSSSSSLMAIQTPYLTITRPRKLTSENYKPYAGVPGMEVVALSEQTGFVKVAEIHLNNIPATGAEMDELESLLRGGIQL